MWSSIFFAFFAANLLFIANLVKADITYEPNWQVPYPGELDSRTIYVVGEPNDYEIFASNYGGGKQSSAQCERLLNNQEGHFTGPCQTNVKEHDQTFNIQCTSDRKNAASVIFFKDGGSNNQQASIVTAGSAFGGFTNESKNEPLRQSTTKPIIGKGDRVSVVISCGSSNRGDYGTR